MNMKSIQNEDDFTQPEGIEFNKTTRMPMILPALFPNYSQNEEKTWKGPFSFVHACDPQLGLIEKHILKYQDPGWKVDLSHLKCTIKMINEIRPKPKFLVFGGDMVDCPPYEDVLHIHSAQYNDFKFCLNELDPEIKLIFVCGNHDVGDIPTEATLDMYRTEFGQEYFSFWEGGVKFTVLNSQFFKYPEALPMDSCHQLEFLNQIKDETAVHHVIFQHIPLCIESEDEIDISFLNINKPIRKEIFESISKAGVKYIFYGHTHRNGISNVRDIEQVLTAAVGGTFDDTKSGFRVVYVGENNITHEYIPLDMQFKELDANDCNTSQQVVELLKEKLEKSEKERKHFI